MIKLAPGNVLLKPAQRRQLMSWLRRAAKMGERVGRFVLTLTLKRTGRMYEAQAHVNDRAGSFDVRERQTDVIAAIRNLVRSLTSQLHLQALARG
jgi:ribosome-associated translation inhibitor RaiA